MSAGFEGVLDVASKKRLGIGLIGSGFMGKTHALGFATASRVFDLPFDVDLAVLADVDAATAARAARSLGFRRSTGNWRDLLDDPELQVIDITTPNTLHREMALASIAAGKHVYCEKPLAPTAADALEMTQAAAKAGLATQVGFNYLKNPMLALAKRLIEAGEIGEVRTFRGVHAEDYMADAQSPWTWRLDPAGGGGALADIGSHALATARYLIGPITELIAAVETPIADRPVKPGARETRPVEVDDVARLLVRFANGATGNIEANWIATGRKMQHDFEVYGSRGAILFSQERLNELGVYFIHDKTGVRGFRTVFAAPEHEPYGAFCVAPGHQIGFNDLKAIEVRDFIRAVAGEPTPGPDFAEGYEIQKLVETAYHSARERRWMTVD
jgi:predicted dehydrogenase